MQIGKISDSAVDEDQRRLKGDWLMKISRDECDKEFSARRLILSDEKCKPCKYFYLCPFISRAMDEVVNGDD